MRSMSALVTTVIRGVLATVGLAILMLLGRVRRMSAVVRVIHTRVLPIGSGVLPMLGLSIWSLRRILLVSLLVRGRPGRVRIVWWLAIGLLLLYCAVKLAYVVHY